MVMEIIELDVTLPYEGRGTLLREIMKRLQGRIRDIHFFPPDSMGLSRVRMEVLADEIPKGIERLRGVRVRLRVMEPKTV
ncbi:hypothetical protein [Thermococcus sp.]